MSVVGSLSEFSVPEVLRFLQDGKKTGLLSIQAAEPNPGPGPDKFCFIWVNQGRVVSATSRLDGRCLAAMLRHRRYVSGLTITRLIRRCPPDMPLGLFLRSKGVLQAKQLKLLFALQVIQQVCGLFQLSDGRFRFDSKAPMPKVEMTGLSIPASEVTLPGLRALKNWTALENKLPDPASGLKGLGSGQPSIRINQTEWQVWSLADGSTSLKQMAAQLGQPVEVIQRIAFRLIFVGLVEEVPVAVARPTVDATVPAFSQPGGTAEPVSPNFIKNLMGYLRHLPKTS
ncbi:MAG: DUF4388 domain-containing protein [Cyanobacteria bacterium J06627_15]